MGNELLCPFCPILFPEHNQNTIHPSTHVQGIRCCYFCWLQARENEEGVLAKLSHSWELLGHPDWVMIAKQKGELIAQMQMFCLEDIRQDVSFQNNAALTLEQLLFDYPSINRSELDVLKSVLIDIISINGVREGWLEILPEEQQAFQWMKERVCSLEKYYNKLSK